jgi:NAD-dependent dihydropyrimidine dehydrogenase PreA subunit
VNVPAEDALLAEFDVTARCTGCAVCATLCPTGALIAGGTERTFSLAFRPDRCTNCGVCVATCLPRAISRRETASLDHLLGTQEFSLFQAGKATCRVCRAAFLTDGGEICPLCAERSRKHMAALQGMFRGTER